MSDGARPRAGQPLGIPAPGPSTARGHHPAGLGSAAAGPGPARTHRPAWWGSQPTQRL